MVKCLPATQEAPVWSLGWEVPLEKEMATHSSTLAWKISWMEEPGRLQSMKSQRVGHDWATSLCCPHPCLQADPQGGSRGRVLAPSLPLSNKTGSQTPERWLQLHRGCGITVDVASGRSSFSLGGAVSSTAKWGPQPHQSFFCHVIVSG